MTSEEIEYSLVFYELVKKLDTISYDAYSQPLDRKACAKYSLTEPAVQYRTLRFPMVMYDIEVSRTVNQLMIDKWVKHHSMSTFWYLIVPKECCEEVRNICKNQNLKNWLVFGYQILSKEKNRMATIEFQ